MDKKETAGIATLMSTGIALIGIGADTIRSNPSDINNVAAGAITCAIGLGMVGLALWLAQQSVVKRAVVVLKAAL